jgi:ribulose-bisphosphate carboxylase large chain
MLDVNNRPLFFGVIKPNIGLSPEISAALAYEGWVGGLDIAKDDEMLGDVLWSTLKKRAEIIGKARLKSEKKTGKKKIYLANITDEVDRLVELHDIAVAGGANALLVNGMTTGLSAVRMLRKHARVPLVGHMPFVAAFTRAPYMGVHSKLVTKLQRLAGFDAYVMPGFGERMKTPASEVIQNIDACTRPMGHIKSTLPVLGGSQWAGSAPDLAQKLKSVDFGIVPGRAVFSHPMGPRAGAASLLQAWEAYQNNVSLTRFAQDHPELRTAMEAFGS